MIIGKTIRQNTPGWSQLSNNAIDLAIQDGAVRRVAVDVGGTFTDVFGFAPEGGWVAIAKVPTTPDDPVRGVVRGLDAAAIDLSRVAVLIHGTTVATNALLTRDLPATAMVTTRGFRDVIEIGNATKEDLWDVYSDTSAPYIRRRDRFVVTERIDSEGWVVRPLDESDAAEVIEQIRSRGYRSIAVCFINSYVNPEHEQRMAAMLREALPNARVITSSEVLPEILEFDRFSTATASAVLAPVVAGYLERMSKSIEKSGYRGQILLLHSGGGVMTAEDAERHAVRLAASGLVAGAVACRAVAELCGYENAIGLDIGGTSADISLVAHGQLRTTNAWYVEFGHPICLPSVDVTTVGAGGGSVAWIDEGGSLRSGPKSAGAFPGPASYGFGGTQPTNTDAHLVLGQLGGQLAAGSRVLNQHLATGALQEYIARPLSMSVEDAAACVLEVSSANMANGLRMMTLGHGYDQRDFALVAFGGAGPMFAAMLASELSIPCVIVPPHPGVTSALGGLLVDMRHDYSQMYLREAEEADPDDIEIAFASLEHRAHIQLAKNGVPPESRSLARSISMRYIGQWRSLDVPVAGPIRSIEPIIATFNETHLREFKFELAAPAELYRLRVAAFGVVPKFVPARHPSAKRRPQPNGQRRVRFIGSDEWLSTPVFDRSTLPADTILTGPAIIEAFDSTTLLPADTAARVDEWGNLRVTIKPRWP